MGNSSTKQRPPAPPQKPSYVDRRLQDLRKTPETDDELSYYRQVYGDCDRGQGNLDRYRTDTGLLLVQLQSEQPLPVNEPIQVTGLNGCYEISVEGDIKRVECQCKACEKNGMINGVCRQFAEKIPEHFREYVEDMIEDRRSSSSNHRPGLEYPIMGGAPGGKATKTSAHQPAKGANAGPRYDHLSPVAMNNVVLPAYQMSRAGHREATDDLYEQAAVLQVNRYRDTEEEDDSYDDGELDSISKYSRPTTNLRYA